MSISDELTSVFELAHTDDNRFDVVYSWGVYITPATWYGLYASAPRWWRRVANSSVGQWSVMGLAHVDGTSCWE